VKGTSFWCSCNSSDKYWLRAPTPSIQSGAIQSDDPRQIGRKEGRKNRGNEFRRWPKKRNESTNL
jgi:hypothetical protein